MKISFHFRLNTMGRGLLLSSLLFFNAQMFAQNTFPSSGNTGIGTTTPSTQLEVKGITITDTLLFPDGTFQTTAAGDSVQLLKVGENSLVITEKGIIRDDGELRIQTADTQTVVTCIITPSPVAGQPATIVCDSSTVIFSPNDNNTIINAANSGMVGIGTFSPTEKLTVAGTIQSTSGGFKFPDGSVQNSAAAGLSSDPAFNSVTVSSKINTPKIISPDGILRFGDSTILINGNTRSINGEKTIGIPPLDVDVPANLFIQNQSGTLLFNSTNHTILNLYNGNVGIGESNPQAKAEISQLNPYTPALIVKKDIIDPVLQIEVFGKTAFEVQNTELGNYLKTLFVVKDTGNVGIGTNNPLSKLDVNGGVLVSGNVGIGTTSPQHKLHVFGKGKFEDENGSGSGVNIGFNSINSFLYSEGAPLLINFHSNNPVVIGNGTPATTLKIDGNVGIRTNPDPNFELAVNGRIRAKEVIVEVGWNDWILKSDHQLQPFPERMNDIFTNQRMPDMQSEKEVIANGADLGKNLSGLQRNTEEIYLYMNQMYNTIEQQQKTIEQMKLEIENLKK